MSEAAHAVHLEGVVKVFGQTRAVDCVDLAVGDGELLAILGPSGCGKTTTLRMVAGFEQPSQGRVLIHGRDVTGVPAHRRNVSMVFQSYALFPHLSVYENIAFGLRERGVAQAQIAEKVSRYLAMVRLPGFEKRMPAQLSGGEQQRVALARALIIEPALVLLDEPLGALDRRLRDEMQLEIKELLSRLGVTSILVTHDQEEALAMADRVAVMNRGRVEQIDAPRRIYENPSTVFCARFLGLSNIIHGRLEAGVDGTPVLVTPSGWRLAGPKPARGGPEASIMIRPEKVQLTYGEPGGVNCFAGTISGSKYLGATVENHITLAGGEVIVARQQQGSADAVVHCLGEQVVVGLPADALRWLDPEAGPDNPGEGGAG